MDEQVYKTLEFDKILKTLKSYAVMDVTAQRISQPSVSDNIKKINLMQDETADAVTLITKKGSPPIMCTRDIRSPLRRAQMSGVLSIPEILAVGKVLSSAQRLKNYPDDIDAPSLAEHFDALYTNKALEGRISSAIIDDDTLADDASPALAT